MTMIMMVALFCLSKRTPLLTLLPRTQLSHSSHTALTQLSHSFHSAHSKVLEHFDRLVGSAKPPPRATERIGRISNSNSIASCECMAKHVCLAAVFYVYVLQPCSEHARTRALLGNRGTRRGPLFSTAVVSNDRCRENLSGLAANCNLDLAQIPVPSMHSVTESQCC